MEPSSSYAKKAAWGAAVVVAAAALAYAGPGLTYRAITNRFVTPIVNGGHTGTVVILSNPNGSALSGKVYDVRGHQISGMTLNQGCSGVTINAPFPGAWNPVDCMVWNGSGAGKSGVYVYNISGEQQSFNGVVIVIK